ncbi:MAG: hypothetical protein CSA51_01330, partial [Gammaproteobacteria bacterium]
GIPLADFLQDIILALGLSTTVGGVMQGGEITGFLQDNGLIDGDGHPLNGLAGRVDYVGHSLGGHLAILAAYYHPELLVQTTTFNGAGLAYLDNLYLQHIRPHFAGSADIDSKVFNYYAEPGLEVTANSINVIGFHRPGDEDEHGLFIEKQGSAISIDNHTMRFFVDALSVHRILAYLGNDLDLETTDTLLWQASNRAIEERKLNGESEDGSVLSLDLIMQHLATMIGEITYKDEEGKDVNLSLALLNEVNDAEQMYQYLLASGQTFQLLPVSKIADPVATATKDTSCQGTALRYALLEGAPFVIIPPSGHDKGIFQSSQTKYQVDQHSEHFWNDRLDYYNLLMERNEHDRQDWWTKNDGTAYYRIGSGETVYIDKEADSIFFGESTSLFYDPGIPTGTVKLPDMANASKVYFGTDNDDTYQSLTGDAARSDHLYGMGGDDTLVGGDGNDHLDGGAGSDTLHGGKGQDQLYGKGGDDHFYAGENRDILVGGAGLDTYYFNTGDGVNKVYDTDGVLVINGTTITSVTPVTHDIDMYKDNDQNTYVALPDRIIVEINGSPGDRVIIRDTPEIWLASLLGAPIETPRGSLDINNFVATGVYTPETPAPAVTLHVSNRSEMKKSPYYPVYSPYVNSADDMMIINDSDDTNPGDGLMSVWGADGETYIRGNNNNEELYGDYNVGDGQGGDDHLMGMGGNDVLVGDFGDDRLDGGTGNDTLRGGDGNDIMVGGSGDDIFQDDYQVYSLTPAEYNIQYQNTGADILLGGDGDDSLHASVGSDYLDGGMGDDELYGGAHDDIIMGGEGQDLLFGDLFFWKQTDSFRPWYTGAIIEALDSAGNDLLYGGAGDDQLLGGAGNDELEGGDGNDTLIGDLLARREDLELNPAVSWEFYYSTESAYHGQDVLRGGAGDDKLVGGGNDDHLEGGAGNDRLMGDGDPNGVYHIDITSLHGNDTLYGDAGDDSLFGGGGNDSLDGGVGDDSLFGASGNDFLAGGEGNDQIAGDEGNDTAEGGAGNDSIWGGEGDDILTGGDGVDLVQGGAGNDVLNGGAGDGDTLYGEQGNDTYSLKPGDEFTIIYDSEGVNALRFDSNHTINDLVLSRANGRYFIDYTASDYVAVDAATLYKLGRIELANGDSFGHKELLHRAQPGRVTDQTITFSDAIDVNNLGLSIDADDLIITYSGTETDWVDIQSLLDQGVIAYRSDSVPTMTPVGGSTLGETSTDLVLVNFFKSDRNQYVNALANSSGAVDLAPVHNGENLEIVGTIGPDILQGGRGDDRIYGSLGADYLSGSYGADELYGGLDADLLHGNEGDDSLFGGDGSDKLYGEAGNDVLQGGNGNDLLEGGYGNDHLIGGEGNDQLYSRVEQPTQVTPFGVLDEGVNVLEGGDGDDVLMAGSVEDTLYGGTGADDLLAGAGIAYLFGGEGADRLYAGSGTGILDAGPGSDSLYGNENGSTTYLYHIGDGTQTIYNQKGSQDIDTLVLGAGITPDNITFNHQIRWNQTGLEDHNLIIFMPDGGQLLLEDYFNEKTANFEDRETTFKMDTIRFDDGTEYTIDDVRAIVLEGTEGDDNITAFVSDDILLMGAGDDQLDGSYGSDTYLYRAGNGKDTIFNHDETASNIDRLVFGAGITPDDVSLSRTYQLFGEKYLELKLSPEEVVTIPGFFEAIESSNSHTTIDYIEFANGIVWSQSEIVNRANTPTEEANYIAGDAGDNYIEGLGGNDKLVGRAGDDTLDGGDGVDELHGDDGDDTLLLGANGTSGLEYAYAGEGNDLVVFDLSEGSLIYSNSDEDMNDIDTLEITGSSDIDEVLVLRSLDDLVIWSATDPDHKVMNHSQFTNEQKIVEKLTVAGQTVQLPYVGVFNSIQDGVYLSVSDTSGLSYYQYPSRDIEPGYEETGHSFYTNGADGAQNTNLVGTVRSDVLIGDSRGNELQGYDGNDWLRGKEGDDTLVGYSGDDVLIGGTGNDRLAGGPGNDVYSISPGDGSDTISGEGEGAGDNDRIVFGSGILIGDIRIELNNSLYSDDFLYISANQKVTLKEGPGYIEWFEFADGSVLSYSQLLDVVQVNHAPTSQLTLPDQATAFGEPWAYRLPDGLFSDEDGDDLVITVSVYQEEVLPAWLDFDGVTLSGTPEMSDFGELDIIVTASDQTQKAEVSFSLDITGPDGAWVDIDNQNYYEGGNGPDIIYGLDGDDYLVGSGGNDEMYGGDGNDAVHGGPGSDILSGGEGYDWLKGGSGNNLFIDSPGDTSYIFHSEDVGSNTISDIGGVDHLSVYKLNIEDLTVNKSADDIIIRLSDSLTVTVQDWFVSTDNQIEYLFYDETGPLEESVDITADALGTLATTGNMPPVSYGGLGLMVYVGDSVQRSIDGVFYDLEGDELSYSVSQLPSWLSFDGASFQGTPTDGDFGDSSFIVSAFDGEHSFDMEVGVRVNYRFSNRIDGTRLGESLTGSAQNDEIFGYGGDDQIDGLEGHDFLSSGYGDDTLSGGEGNDQLFPGWGADVVSGGKGNDYVEFAPGDTSYVFETGDGMDVITDLGGEDVFYLGDEVNSFDRDDLVVEREGDDIVINFGSGLVTTIKDWYLDMANQIESFVYKNDGAPGSSFVMSAAEMEAMVGVSVNTAPIIQNPLSDIIHNEDEVFNLTIPQDTFTDADGDLLELTAQQSDGSALPGWLGFDGEVLSGTPVNGDVGVLSIDIVASDGQHDVTDNFTLTIANVNDTPIPVDDAGTGSQDSEWAVSVQALLSNDSDEDGDSLSVSAVANPINGSVVLDSQAGEITFIPDPGFHGAASFDYTLTDGKEVATATVFLTIEAATPSPTTELSAETGELSISQSASDQWHTISFGGTYTNPVIVAGPLSNNDTEPATIRVRNVTETSAEIQIDEWDYLDGTHGEETFSYIVVEAGTYELGGVIIEAGAVTNNSEFQKHGLSAGFTATPVIMTQLASDNETDAAGIRLKNISATGFELQLEEQESKGNHINETVHYLAVEGGGSVILSNGNNLDIVAGTTGDIVRHRFVDASFSMNSPGLLANMQTTDGGDTSTVRYQNLTSAGVQVKVVEETSGDIELWHTTENVGFVAFNEYQPQILPIETGTITVDQPDPNQWHQISFDQSYTDAVVVFGPLSSNDSDPATIRVRNVTDTSVEFQIDEWDYLDGIHGQETVNYLVMEAGTYETNGVTIEAGSLDAVTNVNQTGAFTQGFDTPPVVLATVTSTNETDAVVLRIDNTTASRFTIKLQEQESTRKEGHVAEEVHYLAMSGSGEVDTVNGNKLEILSGKTGNSVKHTFYEIGLTASGVPAFFADMQTSDGNDTANVRYQNLGANSVEVNIDEEQSANSELFHTTELIGFVTITDQGLM